MVTLVLETGAGVPGANSYASVIYADDYFSGHPFYADAWADITDSSRKAALLIYASRQLDSMFVWQGYRSTDVQGLDWPRYGVYDDYGAVVGQYAVPDAVRRAACEMAFYLTKGDQEAASQQSSGIDRLKIDVIELEFSSSSSSSATVVPGSVRSLLRGLGQYAQGIRVRKVLVG